MAVPLNERSTAGPNAGSQTAGCTEASGAARLRLLNSMPKQHQEYFFKVIRNECARYIALTSDPGVWQPGLGELSSEVFAKLLGASGIGMEGFSRVRSDEEVPTVWAISDDPERDERVVWLIDQVGGQRALMHRQEDIRRRLHGGKWKDGGYRQVQLETEHIKDLSVPPDDPQCQKDIRDAWHGLLNAAVSEFRAGDDILLLLDLMAHDPEVRARFRKGWPVSQIVSALNLKYPISPWNDNRVENAKKRLKNWIARLKRIHGLDADALKDLFARRGRQGLKI
jgi:hypothetical protein